jgi:hypothetical protein
MGGRAVAKHTCCYCTVGPADTENVSGTFPMQRRWASTSLAYSRYFWNPARIKPEAVSLHTSSGFPEKFQGLCLCEAHRASASFLAGSMPVGEIFATATYKSAWAARVAAFGADFHETPLRSSAVRASKSREPFLPIQMSSTTCKTTARISFGATRRFEAIASSPEARKCGANRLSQKMFTKRRCSTKCTMHRGTDWWFWMLYAECGRTDFPMLCVVMLNFDTQNLLLTTKPTLYKRSLKIVNYEIRIFLVAVNQSIFNC